MAVKLTAFQRRTAEKYKHLLEAAEIRKAFGERKTRKLRSIQAEYKKITNQTKVLQREFHMASRRGEGHKMRALDLRIDNMYNRIFDLREQKYDMELEQRISRGFIEVVERDESGVAIGSKTVAIDLTEPPTEEQQAMIDSVKWRADGYRFKGDQTMTTFYHKYGFDSISDEAIRIMLIGEDWKL